MVGFVGGLWFKNARTTPPSIATLINQRSGQPSGVDFSLFWETWDNLHKRYVDPTKLDTQKLVYGAISGLVDSVGDPYTVFLPPKLSEQFATEIKGSFGGVGIEIGIRNNSLTVIAPIKDSPAYKAGLQAGDTIEKIDGVTTDGMLVEEAVSKIRGTKGTSVTLTIHHASAAGSKDFRLLRDIIKIPAVQWSIKNGDVAHVQLFVFNENIDGDFKKVANEIRSSTAKKIVLDLRNNPGGLLDSAVDLAGYFLDAGKIVTTQKSGDGSEIVYKAAGDGSLKKYPIILLVNKGSASASEILAGAIKDTRGVTLVGEKTFGKGSVQEVIDEKGGSSLKVTVARWYTPNGTSIQEHGIDVDIIASMSTDDFSSGKDPQLDKALDLVKDL